jgi:hypothetical protein
MLASCRGKTCASVSGGDVLKIVRFLAHFTWSAERAAEFRRWMPKIPQCRDWSLAPV